eukprot:TRINITY_DN42596_c0_g1_i1.p1 TRINITY_DN42596_c0_g1~~TRINITY_DN42596_c0_g1_i1.p1  ORF type:complete len:275 (-),score=42.91 TRINITY_DN42596_c0_g1_i1:21-845(-)
MASANIKHVIMVLSGKGGVGKSTVCCQLAWTLAHRGFRVGVLDVDLCGPSVPKIFNVEAGAVVQTDSGWQPVKVPLPEGSTGALLVMSMGFLLDDPKAAVVWRGPRKSAMIQQFVSNVAWGPLDYLLVDTPPGTSDEHLSVAEAKWTTDGAVLVTTPQEVSLDDVKKELSFCRRIGWRCLGIVENMSGFVCPHCAECTPIFSHGGGQRLAEANGVAFLGAVPIDPLLGESEDEGQPFVLINTESPCATALKTAVDRLLAIVATIPPATSDAGTQ